MTPVVTAVRATQTVRSFSPRGARTRTSSARTLAAVASASAPQPGTAALARLQHAVDLLPTLFEACHHASITTVTGGRLLVRVATDRTARRADELQDELDQGPCLQATRTGHSVVSPDLRGETRWLDWCSAAVDQLGVTAVLSALLPPTLQPLATLNLYSDSVDGLWGVDLALLHTLAGPVADALLDCEVSEDQPAA